MKTKRVRISLLLLATIGILGILSYKYVTSPKRAVVTTASLQNVQSGRAIELPLYIDTKGYTINAAEVYLNFDPQSIEVKSVSKENSFFQLWITDQPKFDNEKGEISFAGGLPTPGYKGKGQIGSIVLIVQKPSRAKLTFDPKTRILLNDGVGTAIPLRLPPIVIYAK